MKRVLVMAAQMAIALAVAACGNTTCHDPGNCDGLGGLRAEVSAAYQRSEEGFHERHPQLTASEQSECFQSSRAVPGIMARSQYRETCLERYEARQGK